MTTVALALSSGPTTRNAEITLNGHALEGVTRLTVSGQVGELWSASIQAYICPALQLELEAAGVSIFNVNPMLRDMLAELTEAAGRLSIDPVMLAKVKHVLATWP